MCLLVFLVFVVLAGVPVYCFVSYYYMKYNMLCMIYHINVSLLVLNIAYCSETEKMSSVNIQ